MKHRLIIKEDEEVFPAQSRQGREPREGEHGIGAANKFT
jgi:hypothetical protein